MFKRRNKYGNKKVVYDGIEFVSTLEGHRYLFLRQLEREGKITDLQLQVRFEVIPQQTITIQQIGKRGLPIKPKIVVAEQNTEYIADFTYFLPDGTAVIEDTKGDKTPEYVMKRKLMRLQGHPIVEVSRPCQPIKPPKTDNYATEQDIQRGLLDNNG